jgi:hypothetical protein
VDLAGIVYPPPRFQSLGVDEARDFRFRFISETGGRYLIEQSANLLDWSLFQNVTNSQGVMNLMAPAAMSSNQFFRATR